jgi:predicted small lipoprotein YifL
MIDLPKPFYPLFAMRLMLLLLLAMLALAGCGKKGALYMPDRATPVHTQPDQK